MAISLRNILFLAIIIVTRISSQTLSSITVITDSVNPGDGTDLNIDVYWNTNQYNCIFFPTSSQTNTAFTCNSGTWTQSIITPSQYVPYHMQLQYESTIVAIQISSIVIEDTIGNTYTIDDFCIRLVYNIICSSSCHVYKLTCCHLSLHILCSTRNGMYFQ